MLKVIIDTSVILSGVLFGGTPALLLDAIQQHKFTFCSSQEHQYEVFDKLTHKFMVDDDVLNKVSILFSHSLLYTPTQKVSFSQDSDDAYLLELAQVCEADYFITGDKKHLLPLKIWEKTSIISPLEAKNILL